jgi:predicted SAM-dependent methyltransferase
MEALPLMRAKRLRPLRTLRWYTDQALRNYWEGISALRRRKEWEAERERVFSNYFQAQRVRKLHLGAGTNVLDGWLNTDLAPVSASVSYLDVTEPFPFAVGSFDYIYSEHLIEHITFNEGQRMLNECHRVLRPGGAIRVATPDLLKLLSLFGPNREYAAERYIDWAVGFNNLPGSRSAACAVLNNFMHAWEHRFIYDPDTLMAAMESAGFSNVAFCRPGESDDAHLRGIELHGESIGEEYNQFETMVVEAGVPR